MTESNPTRAAEVIVHRGYQIRLTHARLEWISAVTLPEQRRALLMAHDRETAFNKAYDWDDLQTAPGKASE
ncbi:hypothetical protein BB934_34525 (plasmid) [Microvirga ossetica]|uniref:Uncharacterized protein n=1 Tax=Microvirga ossetica TaxID=1882682 RepID=A0A1B2ETT9_9HYPH|nr:hypothetical protein [Microvirga ossetica]ANY83406.1 hypothetical protein BB934_34525 [Microvirga ossetica]